MSTRAAARSEIPGEHGPVVSAIIDDLVAFAVGHAAGRKSARGALDAARMRLDELHSRVAEAARPRSDARKQNSGSIRSAR